jgi:uncharacterized protein YjiS (DUF1127 family)
MSLSSILESRPDAPSILRQSLRLLARWRERARGHRALCELSALDDFALKDVGITRGQLNFEASKFFWEE